mgnify:FL=1
MIRTTPFANVSIPPGIKLLTAAVASVSALGISASGIASPVTWDDILNDHDNTETVLMYGMGVHAQRYSPLSQINSDNVHMLSPAWSHSFCDEMQRGQ